MIIQLWFDVGIKRYTTHGSFLSQQSELWFDVGIKRYTTHLILIETIPPLWFDVGIKRYTTCSHCKSRPLWLWFDVGIKRYTTPRRRHRVYQRCGLMQESKDIQQGQRNSRSVGSCGLM